MLINTPIAVDTASIANTGEKNSQHIFITVGKTHKDKIFFLCIKWDGLMTVFTVSC